MMICQITLKKVIKKSVEMKNNAYLCSETKSYKL